MSYANGTTHYNLPQTVGTDKRDWTDTNQAFSDVDTALYGAVQAAETATSNIQTLTAAVETINGKLATDEGNISTLSGKVSTLESTVSGHTTAIADVRQDLQDNIESNHEASATSTHLYNVGDTFYYNDVLYRATASISIGGTIVPSTNCTAITVMSEVNEVTPLKWRKVGEVVGDGTATFANLLAPLFTAVGSFDITKTYKITDETSSSVYNMPCELISSAGAGFTVVHASSSSVRIYKYDIASECGYHYVNITASAVTFTDYSSEIVAAGRKITLYEAG